MPQSLVQIYVHIVFSTKNREPFLEDKVVKSESSLCGFHWQSGYGAFSVSPSHVVSVVQYIRNQEEHHEQESFQEEFRRLCRKYDVDLDERYAWD